MFTFDLYSLCCTHAARVQLRAQHLAFSSQCKSKPACRHDLRHVPGEVQATEISVMLQDGNTPAHLAARRGHAHTIKLLFIRGADCRVRKALSLHVSVHVW